MAIPSDLLTILGTLGHAFVEYERLTGSRAVLVGGAAVTIITDGGYLSGDFDILAHSGDALDLALTTFGFVREDRSGRLLGGWYLPAYPRYGIETVSRPYFDGLADLARIRVVTFAPGSKLAIPPVEDMIADRLGQFAAAPNDKRPLSQAKLMFRLGGDIDIDYLRKRVADEQGDVAALLTEGWD